MNPINRIGMKVVCIAPAAIWRFVCPVLAQFPRRGQTYTVAEFGEINDLPGIYLRELAGYSCACGQVSDAPWLISGFRPLDERSTDIGVFTGILDSAPAAPESVDA